MSLLQISSLLVITTRMKPPSPAMIKSNCRTVAESLWEVTA